MTRHRYTLDLQWTGDLGVGTSGYRAYSRDVTARHEAMPDLLLSADRPFRGDARRWNPELLLLAAVSECHLLSFLHVAVVHGVVVTAYTDSPSATMEQEGLGGRILEATLRPVVTVTDPAHVDLVPTLHAEAGRACFIASSVAFPVHHEPVTRVAESPRG